MIRCAGREDRDAGMSGSRAQPKRLRAAAMTAARLRRTSIQRRALARTSSARGPKKRKRASRPRRRVGPLTPADAGVEPGASERNTLDCWQADDPDAKRAGLHLGETRAKGGNQALSRTIGAREGPKNRRSPVSP